ncbi:hypothetical protein [Streptococcus hyovaginalis]|uniref:hypothetical protein n=1 Tax=Streptococcus hyovaginalis TaxID=149015 RepID=UPI002A82B13E|nr:hypothetical protein [Streptococcus hyovaginalis]MDY4511815.1 hypothetical protein [Streptococcus hyovaginalis]
MVIITVYTTNKTLTEVIETKKEVIEIKTKIQSQMNNGHTVVIGDKLLNPRYIELIGFEEIEEED